ncbi:hypothetical protein MASR2M17_11550 [Aminivibrio sp.]
MNTKRLYVLSILFSFIFSLYSPKAEALEIMATSPWMTMITRFIGGVYVTVKPISLWNNEGKSVRKIPLSSIKKDASILALDEKEASALGLKKESRPNLFLLYGKVPFDTARMDYHMADPSVLPFVAQRVLTGLSSFDPGNYPYFQRRLSEFQTRLDSTVLVGRQLLKGYPVFDLTEGATPLFVAAGCRLLPENPALRKAWERGEDIEGLLREVKTALDKKIPVILDSASAKPIFDALKEDKNVLFLSRPDPEQDLLLFFHDHYLLFWNRLAPYRQRHGVPQR